MDAKPGSEPAASPAKHRTTLDRPSDRELVVTRAFDAPPRIVFEAWTTPALLRRWWVPIAAGMSLESCEVDPRVGGVYRFEFLHPASPTPIAFFGRYLEVKPPSRLVWTNEESADDSVTTVTFEEKAGGTLLTLHDLYPSKEALDAALENMGLPDQFEQLDDLLSGLGASGRRA
ncbi:MAG: SRPBCC family protein [Bauldia sp.]|jgi:uncharacterized protein YndB with AHSA1/START domain